MQQSKLRVKATSNGPFHSVLKLSNDVSCTVCITMWAYLPRSLDKVRISTISFKLFLAQCSNLNFSLRNVPCIIPWQHRSIYPHHPRIWEYFRPQPRHSMNLFWEFSRERCGVLEFLDRILKDQIVTRLNLLQSESKSPVRYWRTSI